MLSYFPHRRPETVGFTQLRQFTPARRRASLSNAESGQHNAEEVISDQ
jgi:hypothetical protein